MAKIEYLNVEKLILNWNTTFRIWLIFNWKTIAYSLKFKFNLQKDKVPPEDKSSSKIGKVKNLVLLTFTDEMKGIH